MDLVDVEEIAQGRIWSGAVAHELGLIDEIKTSDDYLAEAAADADIYSIEYVRKKALVEKLFSSTVKLFQDEGY